MFGESLERVQLPGLPSVGDIRKGVEQTRQYTNGAIFPQIFFIVQMLNFEKLNK
jgi:hypothetical protein